MGRLIGLLLILGALLTAGCASKDAAEGQNAPNMTSQQESQQRKDAYTPEQQAARSQRPR